MPLSPTVVPEDKTDRQVVTYVYKSSSNFRIQLDAVDEERDARGRMIKRGETQVAQFQDGLFTTNIADLQDKIENSFAYKSKDIQRQDAMEQKVAEKQLDALMKTVDENPELATELRSRLTKMQMAAKATNKVKSELVDGETLNDKE